MATMKLRTKSSNSARSSQPASDADRTADRSDEAARAGVTAPRLARPARPANRRGSPEAIEKRRVARVFNDILGGRGASSAKLDGRTEKRRQRLLKELEAGKARGSRELKPLDVLQRVQELMDLGEPLGSIRKVTKIGRARSLRRRSSASWSASTARTASVPRSTASWASAKRSCVRPVSCTQRKPRARPERPGQRGPAASAARAQKSDPPQAVPSARVFCYQDAWPSDAQHVNPGGLSPLSRASACSSRTSPSTPRRSRSPVPRPRDRLRRSRQHRRRPETRRLSTRTPPFRRTTRTSRGAPRSCSPSARARSRSASSRITSQAFPPTSSPRSARRVKRSRARTSIRSSRAISILAAGAEQRGLDKELPTSQLLTRALSSATLRKTRSAYPSAAAIPMDDVRRYYDENRSRFDTPERLNLWRILCKTREEASTVLDAARREPTMQSTTNWRATTASTKRPTCAAATSVSSVRTASAKEAGVKVDPAHREGCSDGERRRVRPAARRGRFVVRGGVATRHGPANKRSVEDSAAQIRAALFRERIEDEREEAHRRAPREEREGGQRGPPRDHRDSIRSTRAWSLRGTRRARCLVRRRRRLLLLRRCRSAAILSAASAAARSATRFDRPSPTPSTSSPNMTSTSKVGSCCGPRMPSHAVRGRGEPARLDVLLEEALRVARAELRRLLHRIANDVRDELARAFEPVGLVHARDQRLDGVGEHVRLLALGPGARALARARAHRRCLRHAPTARAPRR